MVHYYIKVQSWNLFCYSQLYLDLILYWFGFIHHISDNLHVVCFMYFISIIILHTELFLDRGKTSRTSSETRQCLQYLVGHFPPRSSPSPPKYLCRRLDHLWSTLVVILGEEVGCSMAGWQKTSLAWLVSLHASVIQALQFTFSSYHHIIAVLMDRAVLVVLIFFFTSWYSI